uniref:Polyketide synthase n=1 Tax=Alternaria alternantherae TaxID=1187899 RepID=A0A1C9HK86_9PLEO|nr:polyketide synthase [Alternaria alternantherae]
MTQNTDLDGIAIVGMGCKFPGADSIEEYWNLLDAGRSMVTEPPKGRFPSHEHARSTDRSVFFGNYINDIESFDNRFFKKSGREAASMDPQQRLLLEVAYQALESAGFFGPREQDLDVGCFVGVCASDYNDNVASHPANAFSTLGTLRAFLTGRISHFFGLTGPSITYDTACSSSAVAIDAACKAIAHGDCTSALAGGVSLLTSPHFFQNLAAASFLSPTGPTKSFDARADGYCRGEGVGLVVLKKLSQAVQDGDHIFGTILATSVKQSSNKVPITVPYSPSHTALYRQVLRMAGVAAEDVTYLEAHGTGTPIGDVIEFDALKATFASKPRKQPLYVGSVKSNIGHTESTSGAASLIKTLLMMQKRQIPGQANYSTPNTKIDLAKGQFVIPTQTQYWAADTLISCVNNYGAAGSIAAIVLKEAPSLSAGRAGKQSLPSYPIIVSGNSKKSLVANCEKLREFLSEREKDIQIADVAFNLADRQNRALPHILARTVTSLSELDNLLANATSESVEQEGGKRRPVVLAFGGQTTRSIGLKKEVYDSSVLLRKHLDECDALLKTFGYERGLYPAIFDTSSQDDVVGLQCMQFALHYACAQSWIACGLQIDRIIGHSFGQLVALTVAGVLSLVDGLRLVYGRAVLMRDRWGPERGSMVALEADARETKALIASVHRQDPTAPELEIACFNGPESHVLVGSAAAVETLVSILVRNRTKHTVLNVSHGFHSRFCDPILPELGKLASSMTFKEPVIPIETCSRGGTWSTTTARLIADHTRTPVYFGEAVKRIEADLGRAVWIEAGSNSSITGMVRRAASMAADHLYCPVNLTRSDAMGMLADTSIKLWKNGYNVQFWPFHRSQAQSYRRLSLPPYQFERNRHWLDFDLDAMREPKSVASAPVPSPVPVPVPEPVVEPDPVFIKFSGFQDTEKKLGVFTIDSRAPEWSTMLAGHAVLAEPLCPAPLYIELATRAAREVASLRGLQNAQQARVDGLEITSALGASHDKMIKLTLEQTRQGSNEYNFTFQAHSRGVSPAEADHISTHAVGKVELAMVDDKSHSSEFNRLTKLLRYHDFDEHEVSRKGEAVQGSLVYKVFSRVVQYHDFYKGVRKVTSNAGVVSAHVSLPEGQPAAFGSHVTNPVAVDNFLQVPGIYANCLAPCPQDEVFVCTHVERVQWSQDFALSGGDGWDVLAMSTPSGDRECSNDIFVRDHITGQLVFVVFGAAFTRVRISSLSKVLFRTNVHDGATAAAAPSRPAPAVAKTGACTNGAAAARQPPHVSPVVATHREPVAKEPTPPLNEETVQTKPQAPVLRSNVAPQPQRASVEVRLRDMLSKITDVPADQFQGDVQLEDLGIDSLMATEIVSEVFDVFGIAIPQDHLQDLLTFASLRDYLDRRNVDAAPAVEQQVSPVEPSVPKATSSQEFEPVRAIPVNSHVEPETRSVVESTELQQMISRLAQLLGEHLDCPADSFKPSEALVSYGLDSLLCMELMSDVQQIFDVSIDLAQLTTESTYGDLVDIFVRAVGGVISVDSSASPTASSNVSSPERARSSGFTTPATDGHTNFAKDNLAGIKDKFDSPLMRSHDTFEQIKTQFDHLAQEYKFSGFYEKVYPKQLELIVAYTVEAFADLGIDLKRLECGDEIPQLDVLPKHKQLAGALNHILREGKIADYDGVRYVRSDVPIEGPSSKALFHSILEQFPQHADEHKLINVCGAELAALLRGQKDPLALMYGNKANRTILENVYSTSPMYIIMSRLLTMFLEQSLSSSSPGLDGKFQILELGAGTGSTTKWVVDALVQRGIPFEYTFTDISSSLVAAGKRKFAKYGTTMKYATLDIEKEPPMDLQGQFDIVLSTNCIHATKNLSTSLSHISKLLNPHGFVSLVEFTTRILWFDLVFGLLDGWWAFEDGRRYVLTTPESWAENMHGSGFSHVSWTGGSTRESEAVRIITGFKQPVAEPSRYQSIPQDQKSGIETVVFGHTDKRLPLRADIHYPSHAQASAHETWSIGLMIHGGGHVMLSRKDVRPRQTQLLLDHGVLPVAIDYRLCPETTLLEGPLVDALRAYTWARRVLPTLNLTSTSIRLDASRVVVIGWSTGGTVAMSLAWTSIPQGLPAPDAILVFYCPTDYEDEFWTRPNVPDHTDAYVAEDFNLLEGVYPAPITAYNVPSKTVAMAGWIAPKDARSRIVLHMNWHGQTLPVLFRGLPYAKHAGRAEDATWHNMAQPSNDDVVRASPYAQIVRGNYKAPTHIIFGTKDDLIPWQQAKRTADALRAAGIETGLTLVKDQPHLFDMYGDPTGKKWEAVLEGYDFVFKRIGKGGK